MDFSTYLFHPHALHMLMKEPKEKEAKESGQMAETTKQYLTDIFVEECFGRKKDIDTKYMEKGIAAEEEGITLYSKYCKEFYVKNDEQLSNKWITGTPDIRVNLETKDIKCSWDAHSHFRKLADTKPAQEYYWQGQGYMWLDDAERHTVAHCLVNTSQYIIERECRLLEYSVSPKLLFDAQNDLRYNMVYDDIPINQRVIEFTFTRDNVAIERIKEQVEKARLFLNSLYQKSLL